MSRQIEYIGTTGLQYIDTSFIPNGNTTLEIDCIFSPHEHSDKERPLFGTRTALNTDDSFCLWFMSSNIIRLDCYGTQYTIDTHLPSSRHVYKITPTEFFVDNESITPVFISTSNHATFPLALGAVNSNNELRYGSYIFYSCKIYDGDTLVRDYIPYMDDNDRYCFKENVSGNFVYSATDSELYGGGIDMSEIRPGDVINCSYMGVPQIIELPKGKYQIECWGAQGGSRTTNGDGGRGGYAKGTLTLQEKTNIYVLVGGFGNNGTKNGNVYTGGFNGGGYRYNYYGGGGATDVRIGQNSPYARVIVAGGGGSDGGITKAGGAGGGSIGVTTTDGYGNYGYAGTQTGYANSVTIPSEQYTDNVNNTNKWQGGFGFGGFGCLRNSGYGGAGGGGWYGGCGTEPDSSGDDDKGGGGGSGYVYTSEAASSYPSGCLLNSAYYLTDTQLIAGNQNMPNPDGGTMTGKQGNGLCRITVIECQQSPIFCKVNSEIKRVKSVYFKLNNTVHKIVSSDYFIPNLSAVSDITYTGQLRKLTLLPGMYKLECWGAQGGDYGNVTGGSGGYSHGIITLHQETDLYIYVGGKPTFTENINDAQPGGFNGGGTGMHFRYSGTSSYGCGGGGATDIRIGTDSLYARVIVAGGGGGSSNGGAYYSKCGGGISSGCVDSSYIANQTKAGQGGSFGQGGCAGDSYNYKYGSGGGGGGWYGGGAYAGQSDSNTSLRDKNGGGSGYVYTASTASNYPSGCLLNESYYLIDAETIAGDQEFTSPYGGTGTGHTGHGFCRITPLDILKKGIYIKNNNIWKYIDV